MARKNGGLGGSNFGGGRFGMGHPDDPFGRSLQDFGTGFKLLEVVENLEGSIVPIGEIQQPGTIRQWKVVDQYPFGELNARMLPFLLVTRRGLLFPRGETDWQALNISTDPELRLRAYFRFDHKRLTLERLFGKPSRWPVNTGIVVLGSTANSLASMVYRSVDFPEVLLILREAEFSELIASAGRIRLHTSHQVDEAKLSVLGPLTDPLTPFSKFREDMDTVASEAGINPQDVIMIISGRPSRSKKKVRWILSEPCFVEQSDWDLLKLTWFSSRPYRQGELLMLFAINSKTHGAQPFVRLILPPE